VLRLEDLLDAAQHLQPQRAELGPAVVDGGQAHGPQDAVGHRAGPGIWRKWRPVGWMSSCSMDCPFGDQFCIQNAFLLDGFPVRSGVVGAIFCIQNAFKGPDHDR
jgi:hypothetical protein